VEPLVHDPLANPEDVLHEYGIHLVDWQELSNLDAAVFAVNHRTYLEKPPEFLVSRIRPGGVLMDVRSMFNEQMMPENITYWSL
jgi:UDP-N-acetyl-D-glucosamine/UDP-N-acetyl-D-galactosamine dehydrogenase